MGISIQTSQILYYSVYNTQLSLSRFKYKLQNCIAAWKSWNSDDQNISTSILTLAISGSLLPHDTFLTIFYSSEESEFIYEKASAFENDTKCPLHGISFWILELSLAEEKQISLPKMFWKEFGPVIPLQPCIGFY